jgi:hypothetical protein
MLSRIHRSTSVVGRVLGLAAGVAACTALLGGCSLLQSTPEEVVVRERAMQVAAGTEPICRVERPVGSRVKQRICMTPQEAALRDLQAEVLYRNSLVPLHGGRP